MEIWTLLYFGLLGSLAGGILLGPITYWKISKGANPVKAVKIATYLIGFLMIPGIIWLLVLLLSLFGFFWMHILLALILGFILQYLFAPYFVLRTVNARDPYQDEAWLLAELEDLKKKAGYGKKVELKVADVDIPNAFAVSNFFKRAIVVHRGLLKILNGEEVKAVLAHELGHIVNRDSAYGLATSFIPYVTFMIGIMAITYAMAIANGIKEVSRDHFHAYQNYGLLGLGAMLMAFIGAILAGFAVMANIGILGFSRMREHAADIYSAEVTGSTKVLDALKKIENSIVQVRGNERDPKNAVPNLKNMLYIVPMLYSEIFGFVSYIKWAKPVFTHPPLEAREFVVKKFAAQSF